MNRNAAIDKEGYVESLQMLQDDLNAAVKLSLPTREQPYSKVGVLFLSWENDLNIGPVEQGLAEEMRDCYMYDVEFLKLTSVTSQRAGLDLVRAFSNHIDKYGNKGNLSIIVYNGHIIGDEHQCLLTVNLTDNITIDWFAVRGPLELSCGDVLLVMDACYSAVTAYGSRVELLAAAVCNTVSSALPEYSLTNALTTCLRNQAGHPATVAYIHGKMLQDAEKHKLSTTPIHGIMGRKQSITLTRMGQHLPNDIPASEKAELRVLINAKISNATRRLDKQQWVKYLICDLPSFVEEIKVEIKAEGLFDSNSYCILLSMPVFVYNVLKALGPYTAVTLITSSNLLLAAPPLSDSPTTSILQLPHVERMH